MDFNRGGRAAIERLVHAYGYSTRQALCDQLGVSKSTMASRYMRDIFPSDWVIQCAIETGASLEWLSFGTGEIFQNSSGKNSIELTPSANENALNDVIAVPRKKVIDGNVYDSSFFMLDKAMLPQSLQSPVLVLNEETMYLADQKFDEITDGMWLVVIEGKASIRRLTRIPVRKVRVTAPDPAHSFDCSIDDIQPLAKCHYTLMTNV